MLFFVYQCQERAFTRCAVEEMWLSPDEFKSKQDGNNNKAENIDFKSDEEQRDYRLLFRNLVGLSVALTWSCRCFPTLQKVDVSFPTIVKSGFPSRMPLPVMTSAASNFIMSQLREISYNLLNYYVNMFVDHNNVIRLISSWYTQIIHKSNLLWFFLLHVSVQLRPSSRVYEQQITSTFITGLSVAIVNSQHCRAQDLILNHNS